MEAHGPLIALADSIGVHIAQHQILGVAGVHLGGIPAVSPGLHQLVGIAHLGDLLPTRLLTHIEAEAEFLIIQIQGQLLADVLGLLGIIVDDGAAKAGGNFEAVRLIADVEGLRSAAGAVIYADLQHIFAKLQCGSKGAGGRLDGLAVEAHGGSQLSAVPQAVGHEAEAALRRGMDLTQGRIILLTIGNNHRLPGGAVADGIGAGSQDVLCAVVVRHTDNDGVASLLQAHQQAGSIGPERILLAVHQHRNAPHL